MGRKIEEDIFINLSNVAKTLSDYSLETDERMDEIVALPPEGEEEESEEEIVEVVEEEM